MSIKSEVNKAFAFVQDTKKAIISRGGNLSPNAGFKDLPDAIWNIPINVSLSYVEVEDVSYIQSVPSDVEKKALVMSLGGMSYKQVSANLCKADGYYNLSEITAKQLAETDYPHHNCIDLDFGELDAGVYHLKVYGNYTNFYGITGSLGCDYNGPLDQGYDYNKHDFSFIVTKKTQVRIQLGSNYNYDFGAIDEYEPQNIPNYCFYGEITGIMLIKISDEVPEDTWDFLNSLVPDTSLAYEPYHPPMLVSAKPTSLESRGANLWSPFASQMLSGVTLTVYENGIYTLNGTATSSVNFAIRRTLKAGYYTMCDYAEGIFPPNSMGRTVVAAESGGASSTLLSIGNEKAGSTVVTAELAQDSEVSLRIRIHKAHTYNNCILKPMLNRGTEASPFVPFSAEPIDTKALPESVQSLDGWGLGIDAEYNNHIEWRNGRVFYVREVEEIVVDGKVNKVSYVGKSGDLYYGMLQTISTTKPTINVICSHFVGNRTAALGNAYIAGAEAMSLIMFNPNQTLTTNELWNEWLIRQTDSGNPVKVVYALAEPIETDITHLFADTSPFLKVQGGGSITFHNEHELAVPSKIKYIRKVGI
jgi:hypothetical protein